MARAVFEHGEGCCRGRCARRARSRRGGGGVRPLARRGARTHWRPPRTRPLLAWRGPGDRGAAEPFGARGRGHGVPRSPAAAASTTSAIGWPQPAHTRRRGAKIASTVGQVEVGDGARSHGAPRRVAGRDREENTARLGRVRAVVAPAKTVAAAVVGGGKTVAVAAVVAHAVEHREEPPDPSSARARQRAEVLPVVPAVPSASLSPMYGTRPVVAQVPAARPSSASRRARPCHGGRSAGFAR